MLVFPMVTTEVDVARDVNVKSKMIVNINMLDVSIGIGIGVACSGVVG